MRMNVSGILAFSLPLAVVLILSCNSGRKDSASGLNITASEQDTAVIAFSGYGHDFGKINEGEKVAFIFTFENKGKAPLVITSATTSCGCTVSKYDTKPVKPGNSGTLEVVFDSSGRSGLQTKTVTVRSNASKPVVLLKITGEVIMSSNN